MRPSNLLEAFLRRGCLALVLLLLAASLQAQAQKITVTAADPNTAPQGSVALNVTIKGSGFGKGARAGFVLSGTTDPGGISVTGTKFVDSNTLVATIDVAADAVISSYDVVVTSNGRTGKGTELFAVTQSSSQGCVSQGPAAGWILVDVINHMNPDGTPQYTNGALGTGVRVQLVRAADAGGAIVPQFYAGLAGAGSGQAVVFVLNLDGTVRRSWLALSGHSTRDIETGDFNGDGVPDFLYGAPNENAAFVFFGHLTGTAGSWDYNVNPAADVVRLPQPSTVPRYFGYRVSTGDLDGDGVDEAIVGAFGGGSGMKGAPGAAFIYKYSATSGWSMKQINDPTGSTTAKFSIYLAAGALTRDANNGAAHDLVAGDENGTIYVFENPLSSNGTPVLTYSTAKAEGFYAAHAGVGDTNGDGSPDLIVLGAYMAAVYAGPLFEGQTPANILNPQSTLVEGWGTGLSVADIDGDGRADVQVGAPNANYSRGCSSSASAGVAYAFRTNSLEFSTGTYSDLFEVPSVESSFMGFGFSVSGAPFNQAVGQPIMLIGENGAMVGSQDGAGQVYIYRKTQ